MAAYPQRLAVLASVDKHGKEGEEGDEGGEGGAGVWPPGAQACLHTGPHAAHAPGRLLTLLGKCGSLRAIIHMHCGTSTGIDTGTGTGSSGTCSSGSSRGQTGSSPLAASTCHGTCHGSRHGRAARLPRQLHRHRMHLWRMSHLSSICHRSRLSRQHEARLLMTHMQGCLTHQQAAPRSTKRAWRERGGAYSLPAVCGRNGTTRGCSAGGVAGRRPGGHCGPAAVPPPLSQHRLYSSRRC